MEKSGLSNFSGSRALVDALKEHSVDTVFGLIGSDLVPVFDVLRDTPEIRTVQARQEASVVHMADGYSRISGRPGVCLVHNGPGLTNALTGLAVASRTFSPVIVISGAAGLAEVYRDTIQEIDQIALTRVLTKWSASVTMVERIPEMVHRAIRVACSGRPGPVHLDIPRDLLLHQFDGALSLKLYRSDLGEERTRVSPDSPPIRKAVELLVRASAPIIIAGGGVVWSGATAEVVKLAEVLAIPVATSYGHLDAFPGDHPLALGQLGRDGSELARRAAQQADVILALGTRLGAFTTFFGSVYVSPRSKIIHVDLEPREIARHYPVEVGIAEDAAEVTVALLESAKLDIRRNDNLNAARLRALAELKARIDKEEQENQSRPSMFTRSDRALIKPQAVFRALGEIMERSDIMVLDDGNAVASAYHLMKFREPRTFLSPLDLACIGSGYPTALGAKVARPDSNVVAVCGDGGFIIAMHELATAVQCGIDVVAVVLNNNCWAAEKAYQKYFYNERYFGCDLVNPNFSEVAKDFSMSGIRVEKETDIKPALIEAMRSGGPSLVEMMVDPEELNPPARKDLMQRKHTNRPLP